MRNSETRLQDRLVKAGLIVAGVLTMSWWMLIACGLWHAMAWAGV